VNCQLPVTGTNISMLVALALLLIATGIVSLLIVRRGGVGRGATIVLALAVLATLTLSEAPRADADSCPPTAPVAVPAPATTTTTTAAPSITTTTNTSTTTTTTVPPTTTTTTTAPVPDLTPTIDGPRIGFSGVYTIVVKNIGDAPTTGPMTFTLSISILEGAGPVESTAFASPDWTSAANPTGFTFTSDPGLVIDPGAQSTLLITLLWGVEEGGQWQGTVTLPPGIGGETNGTNNTASITVTIPSPPG
jgi:hypothetical protein